VGSALFGFTVLFIFGLFAIWAGPGRGSGRGAGGPRHARPNLVYRRTP
jgi:hypothetical protein